MPPVLWMADFGGRATSRGCDRDASDVTSRERSLVSCSAGPCKHRRRHTGAQAELRCWFGTQFDTDSLFAKPRRPRPPPKPQLESRPCSHSIATSSPGLTMLEILAFPFKFTASSVAALTVLIYAVLFSSVLLFDDLPRVPKNTDGLDLDRGYEALSTVRVFSAVSLL